MSFRFIDLFCGVGGFHLAMESLGGKCVMACDIDENCRKVYQKNYGITPFADIYQIPNNKIPMCDVLTGGFPCQAFSRAGESEGFGDARGNLFFEILRIIKASSPKVVLLENVKHLMNHDSGKTWKKIKSELVSMNGGAYDIITPDPLVLNPLFFGVPQNRERLFILCVNKKVSQKKRNMLKEYFEHARTTTLKRTNKYINVLDAKTPPKYQITQDLGIIFDVWDDFLRILQRNNIDIPRFPVMAEELAGKGSLQGTANCETRLGMIKKNREFYAKHHKIIKSWLGKALRTPGFLGAKSILEYHGKHPTPGSPILLKDCYIQLRPSGIRVSHTEYFPTLVTITSQVPIIGKSERWMTPRECSRLQGFPANFVLHPSDGVSYKQFGNSVNVNCVKFVLTPVKKLQII